jgi:hypothetical protein|tara:strand:- start:112 stop:1794 length:1683 start_codon:yes stop_codon:yes gene_type:complete
MLKIASNENNSALHGEVNKENLNECFVQFYFQCIIGNKNNYKSISNRYDELFQQAVINDDYKYVIKLYLQARDIHEGKGLCEITHLMLETITYYVYEKETLSKRVYFKILKNLVCFHKRKPRPYGSWKDLKYFIEIFLKPHNVFNSKYNFFKTTRREIAKEIIQKLYIVQMIKDRKNMSISKPISLCGKWLPRESSKKFGWLGKMIARQYHDTVFKLNNRSKDIFKQYRELIVRFNCYLDTTQIHMTIGEWGKINFHNVTSLTLLKSKQAFLNHKNFDKQDRRLCKNNIRIFLNEKLATCGSLQIDNNIMPHTLVRNAMMNPVDEEIKILNMQWNGIIDNLMENKNHFMKFCIPCIDVSPSMYQENPVPLHCAIGMGLLCTEVSHYNRAFTFSSNPTWFNFVHCDNFVDKVLQIKNEDWGSSTNIFSLFMKVLKACQEANVSNEHLKEHSLIIFSDIQFDAQGENCTLDNDNDIFKYIQKEYQKSGYDEIPFLIFWNLRKTTKLPTIETSKNMLKLSGNATTLLSVLMDTELEDIRHLSNWNLVKKILDNPRYNIVDHLL